MNLQVMYKVISHVNSFPDNFLNLRCLIIRLPQLNINRTMSSHKWIKHPKLIELTVELINTSSLVKSWEISPHEMYTRETQT